LAACRRIQEISLDCCYESDRSADYILARSTLAETTYWVAKMSDNDLLREVYKALNEMLESSVSAEAEVRRIRRPAVFAPAMAARIDQDGW